MHGLLKSTVVFLALIGSLVALSSSVAAHQLNYSASGHSSVSPSPDQPNYVLCSVTKPGIVEQATFTEPGSTAYTLTANVWAYVDSRQPSTYCSEPLWCTATIFEPAGSAGGNLYVVCHHDGSTDNAPYNPTPNGPYPSGATYGTGNSQQHSSIQCEYAEAHFNVQGGVQMSVSTASSYCP